jgi:glucan biosynthesis protein
MDPNDELAAQYALARSDNPDASVRDSRSASSRLGSAGVSGTWAHCSETAPRRFDIQPIPEYSAG